MTPTRRPTFTQRVIGDGGFVYLLASGGGTGGSINFDFTTGSLPAGITFTRASIGTYNSSGNILTTASSNVARFNYIAGVSNLLIEPSATNLLPQSNNFSAADWTAYSGVVVTAAQFISPDGSNNGWSLTSGPGPSQIYQTYPFLNVPYTVSVWAKYLIGTAPINIYFASTQAGPLTTSASLARLFSTATPAAGSGFFALYVETSGVVGSTDGIYGVQLETGSKMTSYIPTTTTSVTRAADSAVFTVPSGVGHLTYTFDDNTTQLVTVSAGSYTIPVTLNRPNIKSIVGSA